MGFDQIMLAFRHYCVINSSITVQFSNPSYVANDLMYCSLSGRNDTTAVDFLRQVELGNTTYALLQGGSDLGGFGSSMKLSKSLNIAQFKGIDDLLDQYAARGDVSNNPAEIVYWILSATAPNAGVASFPIDALVVIDFDVIFTEPIPLPTS